MNSGIQSTPSGCWPSLGAASGVQGTRNPAQRSKIFTNMAVSMNWGSFLWLSFYLLIRVTLFRGATNSHHMPGSWTARSVYLLLHVEIGSGHPPHPTGDHTWIGKRFLQGPYFRLLKISTVTASMPPTIPKSDFEPPPLNSPNSYIYIICFCMYIYIYIRWKKALSISPLNSPHSRPCFGLATSSESCCAQLHSGTALGYCWYQRTALASFKGFQVPFGLIYDRARGDMIIRTIWLFL